MVVSRQFEPVKGAALKLLAYCRGQNWAGYDPYDALNSRIFQVAPFLDTKLPRLVLTQALKRAPINIRPLLMVPPSQNPKGLALFLQAFLKLSRVGLLEDERLIQLMASRIEALRSPSRDLWCWGYSFPWQTRSRLVPRGEPNAVCTIFVANALLDLYEHNQDKGLLEKATSAAEYVLRLVWRAESGVVSLSYPFESVESKIHNANLLGAALLCRVYKKTGERKFLEPALALAKYSARCQRPDGSWPYGESDTQQWVDNFHTGYNLCALRELGRLLGDSKFVAPLRRGFEFYRDRFFTEEGVAKYFHDRTYPIDGHCVAQGIITLLELKDLDSENLATARGVCGWALDNLWDERGFFYYRALPLFRIKTPYMRWVQGWMLLALARMLEESKPAEQVASSQNGTDRNSPAARSATEPVAQGCAS